MSGPVGGFFAYPSQSRSLAETIKTAIASLNNSGDVALKSWEDCRVGGRVIIDTVLAAIEAAPLFCADLTGVNPNVMFELGFAIATGHRTWIVVDQSFSEAKSAFDQLRTLTTVGYRDYTNSTNIEQAFYQDHPFTDLDQTIFKQSIEPQLLNTPPSSLLYLKGIHETEAGVRISRRVGSSRLSTIVDDPREVSAQTLAWYGGQTYSTQAVLVHMLGAKRDSSRIQNARQAFAAGLGVGFRKNVLILAEEDLLTPLDYRDIAKVYATPTQAERLLEPWIEALEAGDLRDRADQSKFAARRRLASDLRELRFGEYLAENEAEELVSEYFVETAAYREALVGKGTVFIGRKGSGKTANMLKLEASFRADGRTAVCVIRPVAYELEGLLRLVSTYRARDRKGYLIESLWKFLVYTELANQLALAIEEKALPLRSAAENALSELLDRNDGALRADFAVRLERSINRLLAMAPVDGSSIAAVRGAISEALHTEILGELRDAVAAVLAGKERLRILADNLDKAWERREDLPALAELLLGLLTAARRIADDLAQSRTRKAPRDVALVLFVRSDIFETLRAVAREPDKIISSSIEWNDPDLLLRVLEERFVANHADFAAPAMLWERYFPPKVRGLPARDYMVSRIFPRPRDLLYFAKSAVAVGVNRGRSQLQEDDILDAERQYSGFALETLRIEADLPRERMDEVLLHFVGAASVLPSDEVDERLRQGGVAEAELSNMKARLCRLGFLMRETAAGRFASGEDVGALLRIEALAREWRTRQNAPEQFSIGTPFRRFLDVRE